MIRINSITDSSTQDPDDDRWANEEEARYQYDLDEILGV